MAYQPTNRNHYNPCFWTALWNEQFFDDYRVGKRPRGRARDQTVFTLNLIGDKIFPTSVDRLHYDKDLGVAEITPESMVDFCKRHFPDRHEAMRKYVAEHPDTLYLDFETILTGVEALQGYDAILRAAKCGGLESTAHKGFLACALVIHMMRSHELMSSVLNGPHPLGMEKWEYFWLLKNAWADRVVLARAVTPLGLGTWTFWRTPEHRFPLPDSPVMIDRDSLLAIISPRLLLKIDLTTPQAEAEFNIVEDISQAEFDAFRRRAIANSFKDIMCPHEQTLREWQSSPEYQERIRHLGPAGDKGMCLREAAARVLWAVQGFGRVAEDFETWAPSLFDREDLRAQTEHIRNTW